ncbi:MAG TPA: RelA/SpoT family protein [Saprospirales bacterium]|nr:RelA/SpoT family protein [Saprospirales bacterium]
MSASKEISEVERKKIRAEFDSLMIKLNPKLSGDDLTHLKRAYEMAVHGHRFQRRKSGEPYILHPIEVARIAFEEMGLGPTAIICAILHDVVEDTEYTLEDITKGFNPKVVKIVDGLTKLDGLYNVESLQAENFKKVLSTLVEDVRVILIKMCDRIHNLRTIGSMPRHKQLKIAAETSYIYIPLAHRLGLYKIKTEFQDLCLKINEPDVYSNLRQKISESATDRKEYIEAFIKPMTAKLDELHIPYRTQSRIKAISSIYNKIKTKKIPFNEIYDIFAVRIIIDTPTEKEKSFCWQVYSIITDVYNPIPERLKDWVTTPKGNGYESLHTTVIGPNGRFVEVQIRSERMDEIAEKGFAAHWKYKGIKNEHSVYDRWLSNIREVLDTQHSSALEFLNDFKRNLFAEEIYAFTPNGDMKILPKGATALDFAFDVHSDVGYHATAIKINNKLVPMGYKLQNGDQVNVTTNKSQKPSENWLKMVVTGKARSKIRSAMKEERRKKGELGKEALQRKLKNLKVNFDDNIDMLVKHFGFISRADLYFALSNDHVRVAELKAFEVVDHNLILREVERPAQQQQQQQPSDDKKSKKLNKNKSSILINGEPAEMYQYSLSNCCNPVQGDDIFGYLTATTGLKIHRTNCPNATHLMANYGYRILKSEWSNSVSSEFVVDLLVAGVDSGVGVIQALTNEISNKLGIDIRSFAIAGTEGVFEGRISIVVKNTNQLTVVLRAVEKVDGVSSATRISKADN